MGKTIDQLRVNQQRIGIKDDFFYGLWQTYIGTPYPHFIILL